MWHSNTAATLVSFSSIPLKSPFLKKKQKKKDLKSCLLDLVKGRIIISIIGIISLANMLYLNEIPLMTHLLLGLKVLFTG